MSRSTVATKEGRNTEVKAISRVLLLLSPLLVAQSTIATRGTKLLLDLEILGLIKVAWFTKDERRIEVAMIEKEEDPIEKQNKEVMEKDYEASFPGVDK